MLCQFSLSLLSNSRRQYWCLISIQIYIQFWLCILYCISIGKQIHSKNTTNDRLIIKILCIEIFSVLRKKLLRLMESMVEWITDQCQNWISISTNIINQRCGRFQNRMIDNPKTGDSFFHSFGLTSMNAFDWNSV